MTAALLAAGVSLGAGFIPMVEKEFRPYLIMAVVYMSFVTIHIMLVGG